MKQRILTTLLACGLTLSAVAQNFERIPEAEQNLYGEKAFVSGEYETMKNVRTYWKEESQRLQNVRGCVCALTGPNEAIFKVTIPARYLFLPNDTTVSSYAEMQLRPLIHLLKGNDPLTSVIVSCHSDNNGGETYLNAFTTSRAMALAQWLRRKGLISAHIYPYGVGMASPLNDNSSLALREKNRRVTLYFVPTKSMLKLAKKNKL